MKNVRVEISNVNTSTLKVLKGKEKAELLKRAKNRRYGGKRGIYKWKSKTYS